MACISITAILGCEFTLEGTISELTMPATFTVAYHANEADSGLPPVDSNEYNMGDEVTVLGNDGNLTRTGSFFAGWNTQADGNGVNYAEGQTFSMGKRDVVLYAMWNSNPVYRITYDANGALTGTVPTDNNYYKTGDDISVAGNPGSLARSGYVFVGWNTAANGLGINYTQGELYTMQSSDVTLYASWYTGQTYNVMYVITTPPTGTVSGAAPVDTTNYPSGTTVTVSGNTGNLACTDYTVTGWSTGYGGTGTVYGFDDIFLMPAGGVLLYAVWTINEYTVSFNTQGGSAILPQTVTHGSYATQPTAPTRDHYTFLGWYSDAGFTMEWDFATDPVTSDMTLYAKWDGDDYTVTFNSNGGTSVAPQTIEYPGTVTQPTNPIRTGYTFQGWFSDPGLTIAWNFADIVSENMTLYGKWQANTYTVTFISNGGTAPNPSTITVTYGLPYGTLPTTSRTGYFFWGWYLSGTGTITSGSIVNTAADHTLYADWEGYEYYVDFLLFHDNGIDIIQVQYDNDPIIRMTVVYGSLYSDIEDLPTQGDFPSKDPEGPYSSVVWYLDPDFETLIDADSYVTTAGNHTLYGLLID